jgi:hypothetical protein
LTITPPVIITVAITGAVPKKADNPAVPVTAAACAHQAGIFFIVSGATARASCLVSIVDLHCDDRCSHEGDDAPQRRVTRATKKVPFFSRPLHPHGEDTVMPASWSQRSNSARAARPQWRALFAGSSPVVNRGSVARFNWAKRDLAGAPADLIRQSISPGWTRTVETVEILYRSDQPDVVRGA